MKKIIIAGAGFAGTTVARKLAEAGYSVEVFERRSTIGGNAYDFMDESGSYIHEYGPHIFHTNLEHVYNFLSQFTEWFEYEHKVHGFIDSKYVPIPFSLKSLEMCFPQKKASRLKNQLIEKYGLNNKVTISELKKQNDPELSELADYVYNKVFLNYTKKQWNLLPEQLGEGVTGRVPVYVSYDERYFQDKFQYMPSGGYTKLFENMLNHSNIKVHLNKDIMNVISVNNGKISSKDGEDVTVIYTGCIDELFGYMFGELEYRSLRFDFEKVNKDIYQSAAVVNYPNDNDFTRISEFKQFTVKECNTNITTIVREYPCKYENGLIPYYPIPLKECEEKYRKYAEHAKTFENLYLLGRLAEYRYLNMDLVVDSALKLAEKIISEE